MNAKTRDISSPDRLLTSQNPFEYEAKPDLDDYDPCALHDIAIDCCAFIAASAGATVEMVHEDDARISLIAAEFNHEGDYYMLATLANGTQIREPDAFRMAYRLVNLIPPRRCS